MKILIFTVTLLAISSLFLVNYAFADLMSTDKDVYTWTDKIHIRIVTPGWTPEKYTVDSETQEGHFIKISTSQISHDPYKLNKAGNTLYTGEITLTGFLHDVDGDGKPDTNPRTSGSGSNGFLEIQPDETIKFLLQIPGGAPETHTVFVRWNEGQITFDKPTYEIGSFATIQITDADMNLNPETLDKINLIVTSGSDVAGITVNAIETNENSGVFVATISFTQNNSSHGTQLHALPNDMIFAKYIDRTLPKPYSIHDQLAIEITSQVIAPIPEPNDNTNLDEELSCGDGATYIDGVCIEDKFNKSDITNEKWDYGNPIPAPLKQIKSGSALIDIQCNDGKVVVYKRDRMSVACVSQETENALIFERGWATMRLGFPPYETLPKDLCEQYGGGFFDFKGECVGLTNPLYCTMLGGVWDETCVVLELVGKGVGTEPDFDPHPEPETTTANEMKIIEARNKLRELYHQNSSLGPFYIKDVIIGYGIGDGKLVVDVLTEYFESDDLDLIKQKIRDVVGDEVQIEYSHSGAIVPANIETIFPYVWNVFLNQQGIEYTPKEQSYANTDEGYEGHVRVCSPIVTSNGDELFTSSTFFTEPFEITGTFLDQTMPDDCKKVWKTDTILVEPDRILMLWLENYHKENTK